MGIISRFFFPKQIAVSKPLKVYKYPDSPIGPIRDKTASGIQGAPGSPINVATVKDGKVNYLGQQIYSKPIGPSQQSFGVEMTPKGAQIYNKQVAHLFKVGGSTLSVKPTYQLPSSIRARKQELQNIRSSILLERNRVIAARDAIRPYPISSAPQRVGLSGLLYRFARR